MAVLDILEISRQGMQANRQALQTTSNNIANAQTPGYSRQRAVLTTSPMNLVNGNGFGGGVDVSKIARSHDDFVEKQLNEEKKTFGALKSKTEVLRQVESTLANESYQMGEVLGTFFNDVRDLSTNPEVPAMRANVARSADNVAQGFRKLTDNCEALRLQVDERLRYGVEEVNRITGEISNLNDQILRLSVGHQEPNELLDKREMLLRDLSQLINYDTFEDQKGRTSVIAAGFGVLVQGSERAELTVEPSPQRDFKGAGSMDIYVKNSAGIRPVTKLIEGGEMGGLIQARDHVLQPAMDHIDKLAYEFVTAVNAAHSEGRGLDGATDRPLYEGVTEVKNASHNMKLRDEFLKNPELIAAGLTDSVGDNRVALNIVAVQDQKLLPRFAQAPDAQNTQTLNESFTNLLGDIGIQTRGAEGLLGHQESVVQQLENYRESISGVSLEEEAVNMMQFQAVFNASAKALKMGDELFDTILSLKR